MKLSTELHDLKGNRHKTAISRPQLSKPLQLAARHGYLNGDFSVFDYGSGKGNDLAIMDAAGLNVAGWDPHYNSDAELIYSDIVNLGYVLNVIESEEERVNVIQQAFQLTEKLLVISVLTEPDSAGRGVPYGDGSVSSIGTFQKYYDSNEIRDFVQGTLEFEAIMVARGIVFVFKDKVEEQRFLRSRYQSKADINHLLLLKPPSKETDSWSDWLKFETNKETMTLLWSKVIELGRMPSKDELDARLLASIETRFKSIRKAVEIARYGFDSHELSNSRNRRIEDLNVYFALNCFNRRQSYASIPVELRRDVRVFYGSYKSAEAIGRELLFSVANVDVIRDACVSSSVADCGFLHENHSLQLHTELVHRLPTVLRTYIGCAEKLYGETEQAQLVKIHIQSGKVTFLEYDNFWGDPLPKLTARHKVDLRKQKIDSFHYGDDYTCPMLYLKSRYLSGTQRLYGKQKRFDDKLSKLDIFDFDEFGPDADQFYGKLSREGLELQGWSLNSI